MLNVDDMNTIETGEGSEATSPLLTACVSRPSDGSSTSDLYGLLELVGGFGRFHTTLLISLCLCYGFGSMVQLQPSLSTAQPHYTCLPASSKKSSMGDEVSYCRCPRSNLRPSFSSISSEWLLVCGNSSALLEPTRAFHAGAMVGGLVSSLLADGSAGRVHVTGACLLLTSASLLATSLVSRLATLTVIMAWLGLAYPALLLSPVVLLLEWVPTRLRARCAQALNLSSRLMAVCLALYLSSLSIAVLSLYTVEIFPTTSRCSTLALVFVVARLADLLTPTLLPEQPSPIYHVTFSLALLLASLALYSVPDECEQPLAQNTGSAVSMAHSQHTACLRTHPHMAMASPPAPTPTPKPTPTSTPISTPTPKPTPTSTPTPKPTPTPAPTPTQWLHVPTTAQRKSNSCP